MEGHLRNLGTLIGQDDALVDGPVKDGQQRGNELIMGGRGDGVVELLLTLVPQGIPPPDHLLVQLAVAKDGLQLLVAGPEAGVVGCLGLKHQTHFIEVLAADVGILNLQHVIVGMDALAFLRNPFIFLWLLCIVTNRKHSELVTFTHR